MFNFHRNRENLFQTRVIVEKKEELPPELKEPEPLPETRKEAKEQNKHRYLPGERLQMKLNQQARREKKQNRLKTDDVERISKSMGRVFKILSSQEDQGSRDSLFA
jgi:hypothetical protein